MRYLPFFGMVVVALAATACGSSVSLPAVEPDQVAVYLPGSPTPGGGLQDPGEDRREGSPEHHQ